MPRFASPEFFRHHPRLEYLFILSACLGQYITMSVTSNVLTHMNQLQQDFNTTTTMRPWFMASYGLSVGTVILVSGRYGDVYGINKVLLLGYVWTFVWSLLCGFAWYTRHLGPSFYICARTFQGCGVAFVLPNVIGAVGRVYSPGSMRKKVVFGLIGFFAPLSGWAGTFMSGVIAQKTERWDWNYYAYAITVAISAVFTLISVPQLPPLRNENGSRQGLDLPGQFLGTTGLVLFNFAWNQAPIVGWSAAYIIVLFVVGFVLIFVFAAYEIWFAVDPLLPKALLENVRLLGILFVVFLGWGSFGIDIFHAFTLVQDFRHYSHVAAGALLSPAPLAGFVAGISCALLISPKTVELIFVGSMLAFLSMTIVLATAGIEESYWRNTFGAWIIGPFGMDWSFPAATIMLSERLPPHYQGLAGSLVTVMLNYGIATFLGIAGTVEEQLLLQRPNDEWRAWRGTMYFSIGTAGLGTIIALMLLITKPRDLEINSDQELAEKKSARTDNDTISALSI